MKLHLANHAGRGSHQLLLELQTKNLYSVLVQNGMVMVLFTGEQWDCKGTQAHSGLQGFHEVQAKRKRHC